MTIESYWPPTHKHDRQKCIFMEKSAHKVFRLDNPVYGRKVGIEIEIENAHGTATAGIWGIMRTEKDGSLKDNGLELISYPLYESSINLFLQSVQDYYNDYPNTYFSHRCSIHLHIDVGDLEREQVKLLLLTYLCLESLFFDMSDPVREHNPFCVPLTDCTLSLSDMLTKEYLQNDQLKYFALNPCPILKYNSIEFRHLSGTKDIKKLKREPDGNDSFGAEIFTEKEIKNLKLTPLAKIAA